MIFCYLVLSCNMLLLFMFLKIGKEIYFLTIEVVVCNWNEINKIARQNILENITGCSTICWYNVLYFPRCFCVFHYDQHHNIIIKNIKGQKIIVAILFCNLMPRHLLISSESKND